MKIRILLAVVVLAVSACTSSPTLPEAPRHADEIPTSTDTTSRGGGLLGNGN